MNHEMHVDIQRVAARSFVVSKGRLPLDREEFEQWLLEFTGHMADMLIRVLDGFDEHLRVCVHPTPMKIEKP